MRTLLVLAVFGSAIIPSASGQQLDEKILIAHAKNADVSEMDKTLPKESFADWLTRTVGPTAAITWHSNDCGEATGGSGDRNRNLPICVEAAATLPDGRKAVLNLAVGSQKDGLTRQPNSFYLLQIERQGKAEVFRTLGELTARLGKVVQNQPRILAEGAAQTAKEFFKPKDGFVPNAQTAITIAVAVWEPIWGAEAIGREKPYRARLSGGVWTVDGSLPPGTAGGTALAEIAKDDGRILRVIHGQ